MYPVDPSETTIAHNNQFTDEYLKYLDDIDPEVCSSIGYARIVNMNLIRKVNGKVLPVP